ncbi:hypothetical protein KR018_009484, partial [Drosophila ironensis]
RRESGSWHYPPSEEMITALSANFTKKSLRTGNKTFAEYMKGRQLDFFNASSVMSTLVTIEDLSQMQRYVELMRPATILEYVGGGLYQINLGDTGTVNPETVVAPNIDEVVLVPAASLLESPLPKQRILALIPHHHEKLPLMEPCRRIVGTVEKVSRNSVTVSISPKLGKALQRAKNSKFDVIIRSQRMTFRCMYFALELLQTMPTVRGYLFAFPEVPTQILDRANASTPPGYKQADWRKRKTLPALDPPAEVVPLNESIATNAEQLAAVARIVAGPSTQGPYILVGPPGTGKTTTIVEAILQLRLQKPQSRILVTAGSNSACDTIAQKLCEYICSNVRVQEELARQVFPAMENQIIRLFSNSIFKSGLLGLSPLVLKNSNCHDYSYKHLNWLSYGITVATLIKVGTLLRDEQEYFTHVFIDEAGAVTEPEALIAIAGIKQTDKCHVILSGDHKQLGAVITNNSAATLGLRQSLMERLLRSDRYKLDDNGNYDRSLQMRLRRNYRSHPEIVRLFNELYYQGELIAQAPPSEVQQAANWKLLPNGSFPIIFQATHGVTKRHEGSTSSYNQIEALVVCWYVKRILNDGLDNGQKVSQEDIGIVAPYTAQGNLVTQLLRCQGHDNVKVGSVEIFQGREKLIIIATLVRSFTHMGFTNSPQRINVLISRAKSLLILVGNPVTLSQNDDFKFIIKECKMKGNYLFKKK